MHLAGNFEAAAQHMTDLVISSGLAAL